MISKMTENLENLKNVKSETEVANLRRRQTILLKPLPLKPFEHRQELGTEMLWPRLEILWPENLKSPHGYT